MSNKPSEKGENEDATEGDNGCSKISQEAGKARANGIMGKKNFEFLNYIMIQIS